MARGRTFEWRGPDGRSVALDRSSGFWVLAGVKGLGKPIYQNDLEDNAASDGVTARGSRAATRQVFLPLSVEAGDRATLLQRIRFLGSTTNPKNGPGYLYVTDSGETWRLLCTYREGMEGDEAADQYSDQTGEHWQKTSLTLDAIDPYWESPTMLTQEYGYAGAVPFFSAPFFPLKLNANQVLSDISQAARTNYVLNPSAETNASNWTNTALSSTPSVIGRSAAFAGTGIVGDWVFQNSASATTTSCLAFPDLGSAGNPFVVGQQYTFIGKVYVPAGMPNVRAEIFFGAVGPTISVKDQWVWFSHTWTATATGDRPCFEQLNPTSGDLYYVDGVGVIDGIVRTPQEYIDGDQLFCHWNGTAHASTSFQDPIFQPSIIHNPGNVESYPIIQVIGPGTSFKANNLRSGRTFTALLPTALGSGQMLTLDFENKTARLDDGTSVYRYITNDDFWPLLDGDNPVQFALADAGSGSKIIVTWRPRIEAIVG